MASSLSLSHRTRTASNLIPSKAASSVPLTSLFGKAYVHPYQLGATYSIGPGPDAFIVKMATLSPMECAKAVINKIPGKPFLPMLNWAGWLWQWAVHLLLHLAVLASFQQDRQLLQLAPLVSQDLILVHGNPCLLLIWEVNHNQEPRRQQ